MGSTGSSLGTSLSSPVSPPGLVSASPPLSPTGSSLDRLGLGDSSQSSLEVPLSLICTALHWVAALHCNGLLYIALHCNHCTALHCTALLCTPFDSRLIFPLILEVLRSHGPLLVITGHQCALCALCVLCVLCALCSVQCHLNSSIYSSSVILWAFLRCSFRYLTLTLHTRHSTCISHQEVKILYIKGSEAEDIEGG